MLSKYGLVGKNIDYSLSPKIYNYWFEKYSINASYDIIDLDFIDESIIKNLLENNYIGLNFTKPFKENILSIIKNTSLEVNFIKAINTIVYEDYNLKGFNTDYLGLLDSFNYYNLDFNNSKVLILGAGGAARSLVFALQNKGIKNIYIYNRTRQKIKDIIQDFKTLKVTEFHGEEINYIFNATNISFNEILKNINLNFCDKITYYDLNYYHDLDIKNVIYFDGLFMLLAQASYNFEIFFKIKPIVDFDLIDYIKGCKK